jgi:Holliday junction resolvase RusA-like endonuclease
MYIKRNVDIDAILKCLLDAMNNVIYKDDSQITELIIKKYLVNDKNDVKTFIEIFEL